ncbi:MAG: nicotinate phosphoribosyltransferase [Calditrichia bacterium]
MKPQHRRIAEGILFTDQYQLTMAQLYFRMGLHNKDAQFDHFFRKYPDYGLHKAGFCVTAGLEWLLNWIEEASFGDAEIHYLREQRNASGHRLYDDAFLNWLQKEFTFESLQIRAIPEGRVVHPNVPLTVVQGPLAAAQILETSLLNHLNYQTLIATKAARIFESGRGQLLLEFGLRRGHYKGANAGTRAALIGGADYTSNVGVSHLMGLGPRGTHAHSMVQTFLALGKSEQDAFQAYADVYPDECLLLVDTIDTLGSGVPNAIRVFEKLKKNGHKPVGIRLDSGDLAYLSIQAAKMLDKAGFEDCAIVLSNNLDELVILQIITQILEEAPRYDVDADKLLRRLVYGVGTKLVTSEGESSLGGVFKLVALHDKGQWVPAMKISENPEKTPNPGLKNVWRVYDNRKNASADLICLEDEKPQQSKQLTLHHPSGYTKQRTLESSEISNLEPLLKPVYDQGKRLEAPIPLDLMRERRKQDVERLDPGIRRLMNPHIYHVSLSKKLWNMKQELIEKVRSSGTTSENKEA